MEAVSRDAASLDRPVKLWWGEFLLPLQAKVFLLLLVSILAVGSVVQFWNHRTLLDREVELVSDKHLVIASNLALSLSRYVRDVSLIFSHAAEAIGADMANPAVVREHLVLLEQMNIDKIAILSDSNAVIDTYSLRNGITVLPEEDVLEQLRLFSTENLYNVQFSNLLRLGDQRYFVLGFSLPNDRLAIAYLSPAYVKSVQEDITFGELGHSAIFDATGRAIAHPVPRVEEGMMDASGIPTVAKMMNRLTGVDTFFSPPMQADMIAGYTFVSETGWGVMVPQPMQELTDSVRSSLRQTDLLTLVASLALALAGWFLTQSLVRPIRRFTESSLDIAEGNYEVTLPEREKSSLEMWRLNEALKTMVVKVRASNEALEQALEIEAAESKRKDEFLIVASHEIRNPLSGVIGMLSACREIVTDEDVSRYLDIASRSATRLNTIVTDMVSVVEERVGLEPISDVTFDVRKEFDDLAIMHEKAAKDAGLSFHFEPKNLDNMHVTADRDRLVQVVVNLLSNAIKFTKKGTISLGVALVVDPNGTSGTLAIVVRDTGIGIKQEDQARIFETFYQVDRSYSRRHGGLGIGLSIVKQIVLRMGGKISLESKEGEGSEFRLKIPVTIGNI